MACIYCAFTCMITHFILKIIPWGVNTVTNGEIFPKPRSSWEGSWAVDIVIRCASQLETGSVVFLVGLLLCVSVRIPGLQGNLSGASLYLQPACLSYITALISSLGMFRYGRDVYSRTQKFMLCNSHFYPHSAKISKSLCGTAILPYPPYFPRKTATISCKINTQCA